MRILSVPRLLTLSAGLLAVLVVQNLPSQPRTAITMHASASWAYYTSICATPGDATTCVPTLPLQRAWFDSFAACDTHRDADLARQANPRLMGTCQKQLDA